MTEGDTCIQHMVTKFKYGPYVLIEGDPTVYTGLLFVGCCFRLSGIGFLGAIGDAI
jgi:hypothetical protein